MNKQDELRLQKLDLFLAQHEGIITTALEVYAREMQKVADETKAIFEQIKADKERSAAQDKSFITTQGLGSSAAIFAESADRATRAREALELLEEGEEGT